LRRALAILCLALAWPAQGQEGELPARSQALLLLRLLGYDRGLARQPGEPVVVAVAWRTGDEARRDEALEALREAAARYRVAGRPVRAVPVQWEAGPFAARLHEAGAAAVLVVGGLASQAEALARPFQEAGLLSATTSRAAVEAGLTFGLVWRGARAGVLVNVAAARAAGADLDATLFTVAEPVGGPASGPAVR